CFFFFSSRRRHTRFSRDWSSDVCSSDLNRKQGMSRNNKGGNNGGSHVSRPGLLDRDLCSHVFCRGNVYQCFTVVSTNRIFLIARLFTPVRKNVYVHFRRLLNRLLCRFYILYRLLDVVKRSRQPFFGCLFIFPE